jgi:hypothetical protein
MSANAMTIVPFNGEAVEAIQRDGDVWIPLRRVCENLGVDIDSQRKRLSDADRSPWATTVIMTVVAADGKNREAFCLHLDVVPMWLATIDVSRVRESVRPKLLAYQKECARVLRDHFFGKPAPASATAFDAALIAQLLADNREMRARLESLAIDHARQLPTTRLGDHHQEAMRCKALILKVAKLEGRLTKTGKTNFAHVHGRLIKNYHLPSYKLISWTEWDRVREILLGWVESPVYPEREAPEDSGVLPLFPDMDKPKPGAKRKRGD